MFTNISLFTRTQTASTSPLALQIFPSITSSDRGSSLTAILQSLVLDARHPIALEIAGTARQRHFIVRATNHTALDHVETLLRAHYPQIEVRPLAIDDDPLYIEESESVSAVELRPTRPLQAPSTAQSSDILPSLLTTFNALPEYHRALVQIGLFRSNSSSFSARMAAKSAPQTGNSNQKKISTLPSDMGLLIALNLGVLLAIYFLARPVLPVWLSNFMAALFVGRVLTLSTEQQIQIAVICAVVLAIEGLFIWVFMLFKSIPNPIRISPLAYRACIRVYVIGPTNAIMCTPTRLGRWLDMIKRQSARQRHDMLLRISAIFQQIRAANGGYFFPRKLSANKALHLTTYWHHGLRRSRNLMESDLLATLWHLPSSSTLTELSFVEQKYSRTLMIPPAVARQSQGLLPVGYSEQSGRRVPFALFPQFFAYHTLISGRTGEGKNALLCHIGHMAMMQGGLLLIDPYGQLCEQVLRLVPAARSEDVVLVDLSDSSASIGLNPLDVTSGRERDKAISDLLKMLAHIWVSSWGARMENAFEMSLRTLFEANKILVERDPSAGPEQQYTLLDVLPLLTNANFCHALLQDIEDDYIHRWWREFYEPLSLIQQRDVINPIITRVAKFESTIARRIIGQSVSTLDFVQLISERKIILVKLAKGLVGSDVVSLVGATILGLLQITLEEQGLKGMTSTNRFPIILDDFHMLAGTDYRTLVELQKYGATFFLATQSLEYIQKFNALLLPTVIANVKQIFAFPMSSHDADTISKEIEVDRKDIMHLDLQTCYASVMANNQRQPTFSLRVEYPLSGDPALTESIRTRCRIRYTRPIDDVDEQLRSALIRSIRLAPSAPTQETTPHTPAAAPQPTPEPVAPQTPVGDAASTTQEIPPLASTAPMEERERPLRRPDPIMPGKEPFRTENTFEEMKETREEEELRELYTLEAMRVYNDFLEEFIDADYVEIDDEDFEEWEKTTIKE